MGNYELIHANVLEWAKNYKGAKFHAIMCDPPYHLTEITKRFGKSDSKPAQFGKDGAFGRVSRGFMGTLWDAGGLVFDAGTWETIAQHLHPGGFMMAFAGTRGYHRMATAIEDAGFIIHPALGYAFGSGFPKATRVDDQIDSAAGKVQAKIGERTLTGTAATSINGGKGHAGKMVGVSSVGATRDIDILAPATDLAAAWSGHRYGLQAVKPAFEFICVAQKPFEQVSCESIRAVTGWDHWCTTTELAHSTDKEIARWNALQAKWGIELPATGSVYQIARKALHDGVQSDIEYWRDDVLLHTVNVKPFRAWATDNSVACMLVTRGAGALNIDHSRIGNDTWTRIDRTPSSGLGNNAFVSATTYEKRIDQERTSTGRWPANLILQHDPLCQRIGVRQIRGSRLDHDCSTNSPQLSGLGTIHKVGHTDDQGFEQVDEWQCAESCAVYRLGLQSGEQKDGVAVNRNRNGKKSNHVYSGGWVCENDDVGYGDTGTAARYFFNSDFMYERLEDADPVIYRAKASTAERDAGLDELPTITVDDGRAKPIDNPHLRGETGRKNPHPTLKPVSLVKHLASLLLPPDMYAGERRLLVPFAGVASEMIGALLAGWDHVTGIELEEKHVKVGNIRLSKWTEIAERLRTAEPDVIVKALTKPRKTVDSGQRSLFDLDEAA
jgi:hypothetical protein